MLGGVLLGIWGSPFSPPTPWVQGMEAWLSFSGLVASVFDSRAFSALSLADFENYYFWRVIVIVLYQG